MLSNERLKIPLPILQQTLGLREPLRRHGIAHNNQNHRPQDQENPTCQLSGKVFMEEENADQDGSQRLQRPHDGRWGRTDFFDGDSQKYE